MTMSPGATQHRVLLLGGGIGAGKSRVAAVFAERGFEVVEADKIGHEVLEHDTEAIAAVARAWPDTVEADIVDRAALAGVVFSDPDALARLEAITHPAIGEALRLRIVEATTPVVIEVPLMKVLEDESFLRVTVAADATIREDRAVARGSTREDVRRRMSHQPTDAQWEAWADRVIDNSTDWDTTLESVHGLIDEVLVDG